MSEYQKTLVGPLNNAYKDGRCKHPLYLRWYSMMDRCYKTTHQAYRHYGGRGISVHEPWHDPWTFFKYVDENLGPCPPGYQLDRIDNDGNYEPGNIRWASRSEQAKNARRPKCPPDCNCRKHKWRHR